MNETPPFRALGPWRWAVRERTLAVILPAPADALGWAPLGGGFRRTRLIVNHQVALDDRVATEAPARRLRRVIRALGLDPRGAVGMMTGADLARVAVTSARRDGLGVGAWCTAGCANALRVGDRATAGSDGVGTINLIVTIDRPLSRPALVEASQIAVEARTAAMLAAQIPSVRSRRLATGTGTDCVTVAAPRALAGAPEPLVYCGMHTLAGELIGRAVFAAVTGALARAARPPARFVAR